MVKCVLCGKEQVLKPNGKKTRFNMHHIDYDKDITICLCFSCHQAVHGRSVFKSVWDLKYGKDKGFYELAKAFIKVYESLI